MPPAEQLIPHECDVVIIGAGAGGLTAAALLARAGLRTVTLEMDSQVGGYLAGFRRNGFTFSSSIEWLNQCAPGGYVNNLFRYLGEDIPSFPPMQRIRRFKNAAGDYLLTTNPDELRDALIRDFPADASGITRLFAEAKRLGARLAQLDGRTVSAEAMAPLERAVHGLKMLWWALPVIPFIRMPIEKGLRRYFSNTAGQRIFGSHDTMMSVVVSIAWAYADNFQNCPVGGSQAIADWLHERIEHFGAKVHLRQRVARIELNRSKEACGVILEDGRTIAARYVIAACDLENLYEQMLPSAAIPARLKEELRNADLYHSNLSIFLGLDCSPAAFGLGEEAINLSRNDIRREEHFNGDPHTTAIVVMAPSIQDPTLAPPGKGTLTLHCPAFLDYQNNWRTGKGFERGPAYRALKEEFADILIDRVAATLIPALRDHIEVKEICTPVTYWRYTGNARGSFSGTKPTGKNIRAKVAHHRTPVKKLLIGGHCGEYGGGVPIAVKSGANAALMVLQELDPQAAKELKRVMNKRR
ncbi:MAG: FAD-dependent oxidoreductase [Desulfuromonadales bacterium]|nr:FAD-dependent oxidoreductase [Desulfuromonadales bacterium]MDT8424276.1 FAD-dependent oxidoreductase [Desulfuromonadales bacterium]